MNKNNIIFRLNDTESLVIKAKHPVEEIHCCYYAPTIFLSGAHIYEISECRPQDIVETISKELKKAFKKQLIPCQSTTQDIGFLWNEAYRDKPGFIYEGKAQLWVDESLRHWAAGEKGQAIISTWIYNDKDGNIILEITPDYPWYDCTPEEYENYIPYEEWIKTYKPLVIKKIPKDVAQKWVEQADFIAKKIGENIEREFNASI